MILPPSQVATGVDDPSGPRVFPSSSLLLLDSLSRHPPGPIPLPFSSRVVAHFNLLLVTPSSNFFCHAFRQDSFPPLPKVLAGNAVRLLIGRTSPQPLVHSFRRFPAFFSSPRPRSCPLLSFPIIGRRSGDFSPRRRRPCNCGLTSSRCPPLSFLFQRRRRPPLLFRGPDSSHL